MTTTEGRSLTRGQKWTLGAATLPMLAFGGLGAWGTYTNINTVFGRSATALGIVAAGEGATLVLALVYVGLTLLGQSSPAAVRLGLWALPGIASSVGAIVATGTRDAVVYAVTPIAMCVAAEGAGLVARRIVIYCTGVDMETQRRNATVLRRLAYERARAANHPGKWTKRLAERRSWRLARHVGTGDTHLGTGLVTVQRERVTAGADAALAAMYGAPVETPALPAAVTPVTAPDTQATAPETDPEPEPEALPVTPDTRTVPAVTLDQLAAVAGVAVPPTGETLSDEQLDIVLRWLRYQSDPPVSYRQARGAFRAAGFVGSEQRIRIAWGLLRSREEEAEEGDAPAALH